MKDLCDVIIDSCRVQGELCPADLTRLLAFYAWLLCHNIIGDVGGVTLTLRNDFIPLNILSLSYAHIWLWAGMWHRMVRAVYV